MLTSMRLILCVSTATGLSLKTEGAEGMSSVGLICPALCHYNTSETKTATRLQLNKTTLVMAGGAVRERGSHKERNLGT